MIARTRNWLAKRFNYGGSTGLIEGAGNGSAARAYDALYDTGERRSVQKTPRTAEENLRNKRRDYAVATAQDLVRNFATAAWATRKHTAYVASLNFKAQNEDRDLNAQLNNFMRWWGKAENCDTARRFSLRSIIRLSELRRVVDGDIGTMLIAGTGRPDNPTRNQRGRLQAVEGYRIRQPAVDHLGDGATSDLLERWTNGVELRNDGSARRYAVWDRSFQGFLRFSRMVPDRSMRLLAYRDHFSAVRGHSPLLSAMNSFQDVYEGIDAHLQKMKVAATVALAIFRDHIEDDITDKRIRGMRDENADGTMDAAYQAEFDPGVHKLELFPGDRAEVVEGKSIPADTVAFMRFGLSIAMKALDLPDTFLNEADGNFFSNRAAWLQYQASSEPKQQDLIEWLDWITRWRLGMQIADTLRGVNVGPPIVLPVGMEFDDLLWQWVPRGRPWYNPIQEAQGVMLAIQAGLANPIDSALQLGGDFFDNIDKTAVAEEYAREKGVNVSWVPNDPAAPNMIDDQANDSIVDEDNDDDDGSDPSDADFPRQEPQEQK